MTDKQKIKAEVERLKEENSIGLSEYEAGFCNGVGETCEQLLSFINSLPKEPGFGCEANFTTKEELEKEFNRFLDNVEGTPRMWHSDEQMEWALDIARHFANWQKKQMMQKAVEATVYEMSEQHGRMVCAWFGCKTEEYYDLDDEVKVIIIKED